MTETVANESQLKTLFSVAQNYDAHQAKLASLASRVKGTPLEQEYMTLTQRGASIKSTVASTLYRARDAWNYVKNTLGTTWDAAVKAIGFGELGIIPILIGAGVILTAVSAMTKWILDAQAFEKRVALYEAERAKGTDPKTAANIAFQQSQSASAGVMPELGIANTADKLASLAKWGLVVFVAWKGYQYADKKGWI